MAPSQYVVVVAVRPIHRPDLPVEPVGVVVDAESQQDAAANARRWMDANTEWQFGPRILLIEPRDEDAPIDLGDQDALMIQVPNTADFPELADALRLEQERMDAASRDQEARNQGMFSMTESA